MRRPPEMTSGPVRAPEARVAPCRHRHRPPVVVPAGHRPPGVAGELHDRRRGVRPPLGAVRGVRLHRQELGLALGQPSGGPRRRHGESQQHVAATPSLKGLGPPGQEPRHRDRRRTSRHVARPSFAAAGGAPRSKAISDARRPARPGPSGELHLARPEPHRRHHRPEHASGCRRRAVSRAPHGAAGKMPPG